MKKTLFLSLVVSLLLPLQMTFGQDVGIDYGVLTSKDASPAFAYALTTDFEVGNLIGPLIDLASVSIVYSERPWAKADEVYGLRAFALKDVNWKKVYLALGPGTWTLVNSDGKDFALTAWRTEISYRTGPLDVHVGGEVIGVRGSNMHFLYVGAVLGL